MKVKVYQNWGVLGHEKRCIYSVGTPITEAHTKLTVELPDVLQPSFNRAREVLVTLGKSQYLLSECIGAIHGAAAPTLIWYDGGSYHLLPLPVVDQQNGGAEK